MEHPLSPLPRARRGFTLIELLVTVAVIAILAAILVPATHSAIVASHKSKARREINDIAGAVKAYFAEYNKMPVKQGNGKADCNSSGKPEILPILRAESAYDDWNPKGIAFLAASIDGTDPWGHAYVVILDANFDDTISRDADPILSDDLHAKVAVYSLGPNGKLDSRNSRRGDDITTWGGK